MTQQEMLKVEVNFNFHAWLYWQGIARRRHMDIKQMLDSGYRIKRVLAEAQHEREKASFSAQMHQFLYYDLKSLLE